ARADLPHTSCGTSRGRSASSRRLVREERDDACSLAARRPGEERERRREAGELARAQPDLRQMTNAAEREVVPAARPPEMDVRERGRDQDVREDLWRADVLPEDVQTGRDLARDGHDK